MAHPRFDYSSPKRLRVDSPQSIGQSPLMLPATKRGQNSSFFVAFPNMPNSMPLIGRGWNPSSDHLWNRQLFHMLYSISSSNTRHIKCCQVQHQPIQFQLGNATEILNNPMVSVHFDGELQQSYTSKTLCCIPRQEWCPLLVVLIGKVVDTL